MTALMIIKYLECCCSRRVSCLKFDAKQSKIQELLELFGIIWDYLELFGIIFPAKYFGNTLQVQSSIKWSKFEVGTNMSKFGPI